MALLLAPEPPVNHAAPAHAAGHADVLRHRREMLAREIAALDAAIAALEHAPPSTTDGVVPTARYRLAEAARFLRTSERTLKRRHDDRTLPAAQRPVILWDGKTPYMSGAELLRYAREGARPRPAQPARKARRAA